MSLSDSRSRPVVVFLLLALPLQACDPPAAPPPSGPIRGTALRRDPGSTTNRPAVENKNTTESTGAQDNQAPRESSNPNDPNPNDPGAGEPNASEANPPGIARNEAIKLPSAVSQNAGASHLNLGPELPDSPPNAPPLLPFSILSSFPFEVQWGLSKEQLPKQIPDEVLAWNGKDVRLVGYMVPIVIEAKKKNRVKTFLLVADLGSCCFGGSPSLNSMVRVEMRDDTQAQYIAYEPLEVTGSIEVGEEVKFDRTVSVYRLSGRALRYYLLERDQKR